MSDTGFRSRASALGARAFVATLVFVAPIVTITALVGIGLNEALWEIFAGAVSTNILVPYGWALGSAAAVLSLAALGACLVMPIAGRRARLGAKQCPRPGSGRAPTAGKRERSAPRKGFPPP